MSSSELQYITELGGQRLLPIHNTNIDNHVSFSDRLQLLRDKAQAWFKLDIERVPVGAVSIPQQFLDSYDYFGNSPLTDGHLFLWDEMKGSATIFPALPKPSQRTIERDWPPGSLYSAPNRLGDVFVDPAQNLIVVATFNNNHFHSPDGVRVILGTLDEDGAHPRAAGRVLFPSAVPGEEEDFGDYDTLKLKCSGRHIAVHRCRLFSGWTTCIWWLQIWDWQHSATSNVSLAKTV
jgi:hypothetical protein